MASTSLALGPQMFRCSFPGCPVPVNVRISLIETLQAIAQFEIRRSARGFCSDQQRTAAPKCEAAAP